MAPLAGPLVPAVVGGVLARPPAERTRVPPVPMVARDMVLEGTGGCVRSVTGTTSVRTRHLVECLLVPKIHLLALPVDNSVRRLLRPDRNFCI